MVVFLNDLWLYLKHFHSLYQEVPLFGYLGHVLIPLVLNIFLVQSPYFTLLVYLGSKFGNDAIEVFFDDIVFL